MNAARLARLFRERAQLDLEIADALLEETTAPAPRKRPRAKLGSTPDPAAVEAVRVALESQGVEAR